MKAYRQKGGMDSSAHRLTSVLHQLYPSEETPVSIEEEAGWDPQKVWKLRRRKISPSSTEIQATYRTARKSFYTDYAIPGPISIMFHY